MPCSQSAIPRLARNGLSTLFRCYAFLKPYLRITLGAYLFMFATDAVVLVNPQLIRIIIDQGIGKQRFALLGALVFGLLGLTLVKGVFGFFQGRWLEKASQGVAYDMRNDIHAKLASLSFSYHDQAETGQLLSRAVQDVDRVRFLTGRATSRIVEGVVLVAGTSIVLIGMSTSLALLALCAIPLLIVVALRFGGRMRAVSREVQNQIAVLTTRLEQNLRGSRIVKAFAQQDAETVRFDNENAAWLGLAQKGANIQSLYAPLLILITSLSSVLILWYGGRLVIRHMLSLGALVAFTTYLGQLVQPLRMLGMIAPAIALAAASWTRTPRCGRRLGRAC